jgi:phage baseplate assembly protein W
VLQWTDPKRPTNRQCNATTRLRDLSWPKEHAMDIDFPYHFDSRGRTASTDRDDHMRDMIEQLLFTKHGERVNRPDFGSGVMQLVFAPNSPELAATIQFTLQASLQLWLGDVIEVRDLQVRSEDARLTIELKYVVKATGDERSTTIDRNV